tara:strand:- start:970 stop:2202 length:1233 start_codon:yes stop_codon:yes gene_type:complete
MSKENKILGLGEGFGVEMEYMIVDRDTLKVLPISDLLLQEMTGDITADFENGDMAWSNELVLHVVELKTNGPTPKLSGLSERFSKNVNQVNEKLKKHNAMLLPSGAHPFMNPNTETKIWPHEYNEVYSLYDRIFNCKGHGWSNLQSTHINLPFSNDQEFEKLHAAVRLLLPIIPAISASTPILDSTFQGIKDHRLEFYKSNQSKLPTIAGKVIPERAFSQQAYERLVFEPIRKEIEPYDTEKVLSKYFLNSRGAISRFDRMAIEIRIIDIQENPVMDIAVLELFDATLSYLMGLQSQHLERQKAWSEHDLYPIFCDTIVNAEDSIIKNSAYLREFGLEAEVSTARELWQFIISAIGFKNNPVEFILDQGTLSTRILKSLNNDFSRESIVKTYKDLAVCLAVNQPFKPEVN